MFRVAAVGGRVTSSPFRGEQGAARKGRHFIVDRKFSPSELLACDGMDAIPQSTISKGKVMKPKTVYIGRNGELLSRKPQRERGFDERVKSYRRRIGLPEQREDTFRIFAMPSSH
jgi:hypothetical protein